jgi:hypothetical protein
MGNMRACSVCGVTLPDADFARTSGNYCKPCWSEKCRTYFAERAGSPEFKAAEARACHSAWYKQRYHSKLKYDPEFVAKNRERSEAWRQENPGRARASKRRYHTGWLPEAFDAVWQMQRGLCAICDQPMTLDRGDHGANADHDHDTMAARYLGDHGRKIEPDVDGIPVVLPF